MIWYGAYVCAPGGEGGLVAWVGGGGGDGGWGRPAAPPPPPPPPGQTPLTDETLFLYTLREYTVGFSATLEKSILTLVTSHGLGTWIVLFLYVLPLHTVR